MRIRGTVPATATDPPVPDESLPKKAVCIVGSADGFFYVGILCIPPFNAFKLSKNLEYAQMVLKGEMEHYLSLGCDHGRLED